MANLPNVIKLDVIPAPIYEKQILIFYLHKTHMCLLKKISTANRKEQYLLKKKCSNCKAMYVGETSRKLHAYERFTEHRSNINTKKSDPVAKHFNEICPGMNFLPITPLKHVQRKIPETFMGLLDRVDILALLQREQYWIKKTC